jgi:CHAD domain-containing protein
MPTKKILKKPRFFLRHGEKIGKGLKALATLQIKSALKNLEGNNVSPEPVHNARTSIKKIRAIILLAAPALGRGQREQFLDLLHEAGSRLSPLRDSEVQVQSLDLILEHSGLPAEAFSSLRDGLSDIAKQRRINDSRQIPRVVGFLNKLLKSVPDWPLEPLGARDIRRRIRRTYRRGRTTLETCAQDQDPELFHSWRKIVKHLGYQLRITAKYWPDNAASIIQEVTEMSELMGRERDYLLLLQTLQSGPRNRGSDDAMKIILELIPKFRKQALRKGELFFERKPKSFVESLAL